MSATVEGVPELLRKFATLSERAQRGIMRDALRAAARPVVKAAKQKVNLGPGRLGGHLRDNISQRVSVNNKSAAAIIGYDAKYFYGRFVELGTSKMAARPFLRPALDESQTQIQTQFEAAYERGINRKAGDIG